MHRKECFEQGSLSSCGSNPQSALTFFESDSDNEKYHKLANNVLYICACNNRKHLTNKPKPGSRFTMNAHIEPTFVHKHIDTARTVQETNSATFDNRDILNGDAYPQPLPIRGVERFSDLLSFQWLIFLNYNRHFWYCDNALLVLCHDGRVNYCCTICSRQIMAEEWE